MQTATIIDLGSVRVTRQMPLTDQQRAYYAQAAREEAEYQAQVAESRRQHEIAKLNWLGSRLGAVIEGDISPTGEIALEAIGKTPEGIHAAIDAYTARWPANPYATAFYAVNPWEHGFRATGYRWDHA